MNKILNLRVIRNNHTFQELRKPKYFVVCKPHMILLLFSHGKIMNKFIPPTILIFTDIDTFDFQFLNSLCKSLFKQTQQYRTLKIRGILRALKQWFFLRVGLSL